jgi:hypothetical protein
MTSEIHERARRLLVAAEVEGVSTNDARWLSEHLEACAACSSEAAALRSAIQSLRTLSATAGADVIRRASLAVEHRAAELRQERERAASLWIVAVASIVWAVTTTPFVWSLFAQLGHELAVPDMLWQLGFVLWWFSPATVLAALMGWHHAAKQEPSFELGEL